MTKLKALGLTDGSAGMVAQVRALADALGAELELHTITVNPIWHRLPNRAYDFGFGRIVSILPRHPAASDSESAGSSHNMHEILRSRLDGSQDDTIIISCGRKAALVSASLTVPLPTKRIHIQHPQMSPKNFDCVIAMEHDKLKGENVISTPYALHSITPETLAAAAAQWAPKFGHLRKPWNAVLIGGSTNKYRMNEAALEQLISEVEQISGSLLITTSRRTGEDYIAQLKSRWGSSNRMYLYTGKGDNPYLGMLACADHVYVTNDSVNMMSEAVASGKPVSILHLRGHKRTKPARFANRLRNNTITPAEMMKEVVASVRQMLL